MTDQKTPDPDPILSLEEAAKRLEDRLKLMVDESRAMVERQAEERYVTLCERLQGVEQRIETKARGWLARLFGGK
jgi:hypothetical protein